MMINTSNAKAQDFYIRGGRTFQCGVQETYIQARDYFEQAIAHDPGFARAKGWLAYTIAEGWSYGWFPASDLSDALTLAQEAVSIDPDDYQNHWSLATVLKHQGDLEGARDALEQACLLRNDDPDLVVEASELLVYQGRHAKALERIDHAMRLKSHVRAGDQTVRVPHPDWYYWDLAWASYFNGRTGDDRSFFHQQSLDALSKIDAPPNNANLLKAANHIQLGDQVGAQEAMTAHQENEPEWDVDKERASKHFREDDDMAYWIDALVEAGLPQKPPVTP